MPWRGYGIEAFVRGSMIVECAIVKFEPTKYTPESPVCEIVTLSMSQLLSDRLFELMPASGTSETVMSRSVIARAPVPPADEKMPFRVDVTLKSANVRFETELR